MIPASLLATYLADASQALLRAREEWPTQDPTCVRQAVSAIAPQFFDLCGDRERYTTVCLAARVEVRRRGAPLRGAAAHRSRTAAAAK